jgi:hypothetical protein
MAATKSSTVPAAPAGKTVKDVLAQVGVERLATLPAVNRAAAAILIPAAAAQFYLIPPQQGRQWKASLDSRKIHPGLHHRLHRLSRWCGSARFGAHRNGPNESKQFAADGGYHLWLVLAPCGQFLVASTLFRGPPTAVLRDWEVDLLPDSQICQCLNPFRLLKSS